VVGARTCAGRACSLVSIAHLLGAVSANAAARDVRTARFGEDW
jgi:hypothetical protein